MKKVVVASICAAVFDLRLAIMTGGILRMTGIPRHGKDAVKGDRGVGYRASEKYAERAAWNYGE